MIKVLLVDDEQYIREGLRQLVDWEEYGYEIIGEAGNGVDAIAILEESQVDVVFVDIRMPKMTGLELIKYVQEKLHRNIQFVILTGYADFEYARMAIRMQVKNYMLKPIQKEELSDILHKLNKEHQIMQVKEQEHYFFAVSAVVHGKYTEDDLETVYSHVVPSNQWKYVSIECMDADSQLKPEEQEIVSYLQAILKEFCGHGVPIMETEEEISGAALLLIPEMYQKNNQTEAEFLDALQRRMSHHFSQTFQVYAGSQENSLEDIRKSFIKVGIGTEKKSRLVPELERKITAYHEAGHAILFHLLPDVGPVYTVSIIPTGMGAAGYTMPVPENDNVFETKGRMIQEIKVGMGGRIAEELIFDDVTTGASQDIKQVTDTARSMITKFGMSDRLGFINYEENTDEVFLGRDLGHSRSFSEEVASIIDKEVKKLVDDCYTDAKRILTENMDVLHSCANLLLEKERISREEFEALFKNDKAAEENL